MRRAPYPWAEVGLAFGIVATAAALIFGAVYLALSPATAHERPERMVMMAPQQEPHRRAASRVLDVASRYVGTNPTGRRYLWCADAANFILRKAGFQGSGSRLARSFLAWGKRVPVRHARPGDVVILARGSRQGHVGFFVKRNGSRVKLVSGNACSPRQICASWYAAGRILGVRRP